MKTIILKLTHRLWNKQIARILGDSYSSGIITSNQLHKLHCKFDPTQKHEVYKNAHMITYTIDRMPVGYTLIRYSSFCWGWKWESAAEAYHSHFHFWMAASAIANAKEHSKLVDEDKRQEVL